MSPLDLKTNDYLTELGVKNKPQANNKPKDQIIYASNNQSAREENSKAENDAAINVSAILQSAFRALID